MLNTLKCKHRHTILTHPNCFRTNNVKLINDKAPWWDGQTVAYLDIETSNLKADFGFILSWCIKYKDDPDIRYDVITKKELFNYTFDKRVVQSLVKELQNVDILVTFYGKEFDAKFIRTRALYWEIDFPPYGSIFHWDVYFHAKKDLKLHNGTLETVTQFLGIDGKSRMDFNMLNLARYGHRPSLDILLEHNRQDVIILEKLHKRIGDYSKWIKTSI